MKKYMLLLGILMQTQVFSAPHYDVEQLEQFQQTNSCPNCDLSGSELEQTKHRKALLKGADLSQAILSRSNFEHADLTSAILIRTQANKVKWMKATFDGAILLYLDGKNSYFSGASFKNCILNHANLSKANLSNADFTSATLVNADLSYAILIGAKITPEQLKQAKKMDCAVLPDGTVYNLSNSVCRS
jgi:uncharacterized protein YjbI with pentapeptide repeats